MRRCEQLVSKVVMGMQVGEQITNQQVRALMLERFDMEYSQSSVSEALWSLLDAGWLRKTSKSKFARTEPMQRPTPVAKSLQLADASDLDLLLELRRRQL